MSNFLLPGLNVMLMGVGLLVGYVLAFLLYVIIKESKEMKFRILTTSKRKLERVFDASGLLFLIGMLLWKGAASEDCKLLGSVGLGWAFLSWMLQRGWIPDKLRFHILAAVFLIFLAVVAAYLFS